MPSTLRPRNIEGKHLTMREIETETLLYDTRTHRAWCLNRISALIWRLCDGRNTVSQICAMASAELESAVTEDLVLLTLSELREKDLLEADVPDPLPEGISRRQMISRLGLSAAAMLPVIAAITAPPARAQTVSTGTGGNG